MTHFEDLFELFEDVRQYKLRSKECLIPISCTDMRSVGYSTADGGHQAIKWTIDLRRAKQSAQARGTKESRRIRELFSSYMGRKQLLDELREGTLEYGMAAPPIEEKAPGLTQLYIPGL